MRLKSVVKYNISGMKYSVLIFYGIIAAVMVLLFSVVSVSVNGDTSVSGGIEISSAIFLFVCGLNSFKQNYLYLSTNGITRKAQFYGFIISSLPIVAIMGLIDTAWGNILSGFINYRTIFSQMYNGFVSDSSKLLALLMGFVWSAALYFFAIVLGYLITTLYYRMSKILKIIVSVGVVVLIFNVLPAIDVAVNNGKISIWIYNLILYLLGLKDGSAPFNAAISLIAGTVLFSGLAYLLVRRAPVKE